MSTRTRVLSVLMPVHDGGEHLRLAMDSVLGQTFEDFELIVVDDCSTDDSFGVLRDYAAEDARVKTLRLSENLGVAGALNQGLAQIRSPLVARMDSDDVCRPGRFAAQVEAMQDDPALGVLGVRTRFIDGAGHPAPQFEWPQPTTHDEVAWRLLFGAPICHPSVMMRTDLLRSVGGYDSTFPNEDMELWTRMIFVGAIRNLDDVLLDYRMAPAQYAEKLQAWEPHIAEVGQRYAERILGLPVDSRLFNALRISHSTRQPPEDLSQMEVLAVARLLEDLHTHMRATGPFRGDASGRSLRLLENDLQRLASLRLSR